MKQVKYLHLGSSVIPQDYDDENSLDYIKPNVYNLMFDEMNGFSLALSADKFKIPEKIYGPDINIKAEKVISTYKDKPDGIGVLFTGDKGSGKTLTISAICNKMIEEGSPIIVINDCYKGTDFGDFIDKLGECVIVIDEFAKNYNLKAQGELLSLMDGLNKSKRMFLLSENEADTISTYFINRPSRIYYHFKYGKMLPEHIEDYLKDRNIYPEMIEDIIGLSTQSLSFNFDMLSNIADEHLRYDEKLEDIIKILNIKISTEVQAFEIISVTRNGAELKAVMPSFKFDDCGWVYIDVEPSDNIKPSNVNVPRPTTHIPQDVDYDNNETIHFKYDHAVYQSGNDYIFRDPETSTEIRCRKIDSKMGRFFFHDAI
jgi:hypothetical protein